MKALIIKIFFKQLMMHLFLFDHNFLLLILLTLDIKILTIHIYLQ